MFVYNIHNVYINNNIIHTCIHNAIMVGAHKNVIKKISSKMKYQNSKISLERIYNYYSGYTSNTFIFHRWITEYTFPLESFKHIFSKKERKNG